MHPKHSEASEPAEASRSPQPCSSRISPGAASAAFTAAAFSPGRTPGPGPGSLKRQEFVLTPACKKHLAPALQLPAVPNLLARCRGWHQLCAGGLLDPAWHLNFILISLLSFFFPCDVPVFLPGCPSPPPPAGPREQWGSAGVKAAPGAAAAAENSLSVCGCSCHL